MTQQTIKRLAILFLISMIMYLKSNTADAYLVHTLGHDTYGDYSITISLIFSLSPLLLFGTLKSVTKHIPVLLKNNPNQANIFFKMEY